ncbi:MAG: ABC transporter permease, partial [Anaerolineales bacterium]
MLTLIGVAIGIASIVALVSVSKGVAANYVEATNHTGADLTLQAVQSEGTSITLGSPFDEAVADQVAQLPEVKSVSPMLYTLVQVPGADIFVVYGYEPDSPGIEHFKVYEGVTLSEVTDRRGGRPILLGKVAADKLHKGVGDSLLIQGSSYRIVGLYETGVALEDSGAVMSLDDAQMLAKLPRQVMFVGIQLVHPERAAQAKARIERLLPPDVEIAGTQIGQMMLDLIQMLDVFAWSVALVAALVGGIGMMNTMLMSVFERTREIGVLRAVGWSRWRVMRMILGESLLLSLTGGALGVVLGVALARLIASIPALAGLTKAEITPALLSQAFGATLLLGAVGGIYPAWYASNLSPVLALSYEGASAESKPLRLPFGGMALRNLVRQRTRTLLTLVGVGVAMLSLVSMGGLTQGAVGSFNAIVSDYELTAVEAGRADTLLSSIDEAVLERIEKMPEVQYVSGVILGAVALPGQPFFVITGRSRTDPRLLKATIREGRMLDGPRQVLLGWKAAADLKKGVGDRVSMLGTTFTVVGIVETGSTFEDAGAIIDLREAQRLMNKPRQVMMAQIKLRDPQQADAVLAALTEMYPDLLFSKSAEFTENLPDMEMGNQAFAAIYALTVLVGSVALMNTMIMSVYERTREIGVLRALGWKRRYVLAQMLGESVILTVLSG